MSGQASRGRGRSERRGARRQRDTGSRVHTHPSGAPRTPWRLGFAHQLLEALLLQGHYPRPGFMGPSAPRSGRCREAPCGGTRLPAPGPPGAFTQVLLTLLQEKRKGWDISPEVSLKLKHAHSLARSTTYSKITGTAPSPVSLSRSLCFPEPLVERDWGCSMLRGGVVAQQRGGSGQRALRGVGGSRRGTPRA